MISLFDLIDENPKTIIKTEKSKLVLHRNFITPKSSKILFDHFNKLPFEAEEYFWSGKLITSKKKSTALGNEKYKYTYSGINRESIIWDNATEELATDISKYVSGGAVNIFNFVLCNLYSNGQAGVGWHSDDESIINQNVPIASLSLGQSRIFDITKIGKSDFDIQNLAQNQSNNPQAFSDFYSLMLDDGDLLIMHGDFQNEFKHRLKKDSSKNPRINLTFRNLLRV